jgi:hypothetical protein
MPRVILVLLVGAGLVAGAGTASAATERRCGDVPGAVDAPQDVRARGVSCRRARSLARRHSRNSGRNDTCALAKPSCRLDGWTCRRSFFGNSGTRVRCTRGEAVARWFYGT